MAHGLEGDDDVAALLELAATGRPKAEVKAALDAVVERRARDRVRQHAQRDLLTGVANRRALLDALDDLQRRGSTAVAVLVDIDEFQRINDALGHGGADEVLVCFARRLEAAAGPGALVARLGGDRFLVLREGCCPRQQARAFGRACAEAAASPLALQDRVWRVDVTCGVVVADEALEPADLLRFAIEAHGRAKSRGGGAVEVLDDASARRLRHRIDLERALREAVERDGLELVYQPVVSLTDGSLGYAEALLRWRRDDEGQVPPSEFVPIAEESGLIRRLGRWVLEAACREHRAWAARAPESAPPRVAVNVSAREIVDPGFPDAVAAVLARTGVDASALVLEVTETAMLHATEETREVMQRLADSGVHLVLDDFGDGVSSLAHLRHFAVHGLKIDRTLIADLGVRPDAAPMIEAVVAMARAVGIQTVAEGIETPEQLEAVRALGCDYAQGYALGRPAPPPGS